MKYKLIFAFGLFTILGCKNKSSENKINEDDNNPKMEVQAEVPEQQDEITAEINSEEAVMQTTLPEIDCTAKPTTIKLAFPFGPTTDHWEKVITLPMTGKFTEESHFVTNNDSFEGSRLFANAKDENIESHLMHSFEIYRRYDSTKTIEKLYGNWWNRVWTPSEGGAIGQGSVGEIQAKELSPEMEMWFLNMMWARGERPKRGTKYLLEANNKSIVVIAGYETGPADKKFVGGVTAEVHAYLGTNTQSDIKISLLKDQTSAIGPVKCKS